MKISYMLKREDFYKINQETLENYYKGNGTEKTLYIYPELNAIVTARPSKVVKQYLYTEFRVNGSALKRLLVRMYAGVLLNSGGLLASKRVRLKTDADNDTLIYPCNKKYREFRFAENRVSVFAKNGFPTNGLINEIAFRTQNTAYFIPGLLESTAESYCEAIIDGCPVARTGQRMGELSDKAYAIWSEYIHPYTRHIAAAEYANELKAKIEALKTQVTSMGKTVDFGHMDRACDKLLQILQNDSGMVPVSLSHGDLQAGNIWVENHTDKLYIIDWESCQERSTWYDRATLYEDLRRSDGIVRYAAKRDLTHAVVLLEDVIFHLSDLITLPYDYGSKAFDAYINVLLGDD